MGVVWDKQYGFNFIANMLVIPSYGYQGAALITILSEIVLLAPFLYGVWKHVGQIPLLQLAHKPTAAALIMGAVLILFREQNLLVMVLIGFVVYSMALLTLRTFNEEERAILRSLLNR